MGLGCCRRVPCRRGGGFGDQLGPRRATGVPQSHAELRKTEQGGILDLIYCRKDGAGCLVEERPGRLRGMWEALRSRQRGQGLGW